MDETTLLNNNIIENKKKKYLYQLKKTYRHPKDKLYNTCIICKERFHWIHSRRQFIQLVNEYIKNDDNFDLDMMRLYNNSYWPGRYDIRYNTLKNMCGFCYTDKTNKAGLRISCNIYFVVIFHIVIVGVIIFALCMYT